MAQFDSIRFQPSRPLLKEVSADRLNSILAEIKTNRPRGERGITVRRSGDTTYIGLAANLQRASSEPQPWDIYVADETEGSQTLKVLPGTLNGFLASNWDQEFTCSTTGFYYAKAIVATDGQAMTGVTIAIDEEVPSAQTAQAFGIDASIEIAFGIVSEGIVYRTIGAGNISASPKPWLTTERETPPAAGELPFTQYFLFR